MDGEEDTVTLSASEWEDIMQLRTQFEVITSRIAELDAAELVHAEAETALRDALVLEKFKEKQVGETLATRNAALSDIEASVQQLEQEISALYDAHTELVKARFVAGGQIKQATARNAALLQQWLNLCATSSDRCDAVRSSASRELALQQANARTTLELERAHKQAAELRSVADKQGAKIAETEATLQEARARCAHLVSLQQHQQHGLRRAPPRPLSSLTAPPVDLSGAEEESAHALDKSATDQASQSRDELAAQASDLRAQLFDAYAQRPARRLAFQKRNAVGAVVLLLLAVSVTVILRVVVLAL